MEIGKATIRVEAEMDWDTKSEFAEACARDGKAKALAAGDNELARHFSLRIAEILHQREWVKELSAKAADEKDLHAEAQGRREEKTVPDLSEVPE